MCGIIGYIGDQNATTVLRAHILDTLHAAGIEIVSPNFMNQRPQGKEQKAIPQPYTDQHPAESEPKAEDIIFDKAEEASQRQQRLQRIDEIKQALGKGSSSATEDAETLARELQALEAEEARRAVTEEK